MQPLVVVVGGGYAGVRVAKLLDPYARVVLIEPKDAFQHNVAALRALVEPSFGRRMFFPYGRLLTRGLVRRDRVVSADAGRVQLASGDELRPDILVLATGSAYPFPAKAAQLAHADAIAGYAALHANLARARRVLLLGAGAVGLELAGEIGARWPDKRVTLIDPAERILPGPYDERLRVELRRQLLGFGATLLLGHRLVEPPASAPGELAPVHVRTSAGASVEADLWLRCHGITPVSDYLTGELAPARSPDGYVTVDEYLRVTPGVYAIGDLAAIDVNKVAVAQRQAQCVAATITAEITGAGPAVPYEPEPATTVIPFGPAGGAGWAVGRDGVLPAAVVAQVKGEHMLLGKYEELLNAPAGRPPGAAE
jgi:NADH dehydrogenase FAD-containing subunit